MPAGPGGAGEAAGNAPGPTGEVPPAIRETSASTSLRPQLVTNCSCFCSVAKRSPVAAPAPTEGSDVGGVGAAPTTAGGPTPLLLTYVPPVTSAAGTAAAIPPPREDVAAAADVAAAGTAAGIPPPREDVAVAADVTVAPDEDMGGMSPPRGAADAAGARADKNAERTPSPREDIQDAPSAASDEDMGGMPPPRRAADASGVAAGIPPPREDVAAADGSGAALGEDAVDAHGREEVIAPPLPQVGTSPWKAWRRYPKVQCAEYVAMPAGVMTLWVSEK